jgi:hypothetical protein
MKSDMQNLSIEKLKNAVPGEYTEIGLAWELAARDLIEPCALRTGWQ